MVRDGEVGEPAGEVAPAAAATAAAATGGSGAGGARRSRSRSPGRRSRSRSRSRSPVRGGGGGGEVKEEAVVVEAVASTTTTTASTAAAPSSTIQRASAKQMDSYVDANGIVHLDPKAARMRELREMEQREQQGKGANKNKDGGDEDFPFAEAKPPAASLKVYVGNMSFKTGEKQLREVFEKCGHIKDIYIPTDRYNGQARGFAFVTFTEAIAAQRACDTLTGTELDGRELKVTLAGAGRNDGQHKSKRGGGGGGAHASRKFNPNKFGGHNDNRRKNGGGGGGGSSSAAAAAAAAE
jgi:cold-inducible RNA-binding protein